MKINRSFTITLIDFMGFLKKIKDISEKGGEKGTELGTEGYEGTKGAAKKEPDKAKK